MTKPTSNKFELYIPKHLDYIEEVDLLTTKLLSRIDFPDKYREDIILAVLEATNHAIEHGSKGEKNEIHIRYNLESEGITVCVIDSGDGFDKEKIQASQRRDERTPAKYKGIYIIQKLMDEVDYYSTSVGTTVKMSKQK